MFAHSLKKAVQMAIYTLLNVFVHRHLRVQSTRKHCFCVIVVIWKKQRDSCVTFYRDVSRFAFQLANISVKFD